MALINRIEIVNYLCEGWQPSMGIASWRPLWPANLVNLGGASTAIQVPNGGGKTSVTNAVLYLLSQDRVLKRRFLERCSPSGMVATHIRIEFAIMLDDDLNQRDLMIRDPRECPAETYVIGVCANRDDDSPRFYRYPGLLEDAPVSRMVGSAIEFTSASDLQAAVKKIRGAQWNAWHTIGEWSKVVGMFMSSEVVRQNVHFHRDGAGDASAAFSKVTPASGERFDEAYFRQVVAPQLLTNVMGESAEEGERSIEDTILKSMSRFIDAKLQVESKQAYLERRSSLEADFQPVIQAASKIQLAQAEYQTQLQKLAVDAAFLARFTDSRDGRMPGVPRPLGELTLSPAMSSCLKSMVLDKDGSLLIESSGLARLLGLNTGRLNEIAGRSSATKGALSHRPTSAQVIDLHCDSKISEGHGGRRNALRYYDFQSARELAYRQSGDTSDAVALLEQAFEFARDTIDTNSFRHQQRRLLRKKDALKAEIVEAEKEGREAEAEKERLEQQITEWQENQGSYQDFCAHLHLLPLELHDTPSRVPDWLAIETKERTDLVSSHVERVGRLSPGWEEFLQVSDERGLLTIEDQIADLKSEHTAAERDRLTCTSDLDNARAQRDAAASAAKVLQSDISATEVECGLLSEHSQSYEEFLNIFGDVDPLTVAPPETEHRELVLQKQRTESNQRSKRTELEGLEALASAERVFKQMFGDIDPYQADPHGDLDRLFELQRDAETTLAHHQPLAESLEEHLVVTGRNPDIWIRETDVAYAGALERERQARTEAELLDRDLAALDDMKLVANQDYVAAYEALAEEGVQAKRVVDVILGLGLSNDETLPLLSALGPLLDAPVLSETSEAELAVSVLLKHEHDVPLMLLAPLIALLKKGPADVTSNFASVGVFAGAISRRMRSILDPKALEEERQDLQEKYQQYVALAHSALLEANAHTPHTEAYRRALRAQEAVNLGSVQRIEAAKVELAALEPRLQASRRLVLPAALLALQDAKKFMEVGGKQAVEGVLGELEELTAAIAGLDERLNQISPLLTQTAVVAHAGAQRFMQAGGRQQLHSLMQKRLSLKNELSAHEAEMPLLDSRLLAAQASFEKAQDRALSFTLTFQTKLGRLERALAFATDGCAAFMQTHELVRGELEYARDALDPLKSIKYLRAQAFKDHQDQDEATLQRMIGEAKSRRVAATTKAQQLTASVEKLEGSIIELQLAAESLHELSHFLCARRSTVAPFADDLSARDVGASRAESHEAYSAAESVRVRLLEWRPEQEPFDRASLGALREEVEAIDVARTGKDVAEARKNVTRIGDRFEQVRAGFCAKARASEDGGFSEAEIEAIQAASNAEQLEELSSIGRRLHEQLMAEQSELEELQRSAGVVESASIETLTRLVEASKSNLSTMNAVMARNPNARFMVETDVISTPDIKRLMEDLRDHIEGRKRDAKARQRLSRSINDGDSTLGADVRRALIERIFTKPSVKFRHVGMWDGETRLVQPSLSEGQKSALQMLWLIRESEYHLECAVRRHLGGGSRKKLRSRSQRVLFFDGLFSNLTDRTLIDEAFKGLGEADSNLQLIGLIHNPEYKNNSSIFPSFVVGKRVGRRNVDGERSYVRFDDGRTEGSLGLATFMHKRPYLEQGAEGG